MSEQFGLRHLANTASNLTLSSILSTLTTSIRPEDDSINIAFNQGIREAIQVVKIYQNVIQAEMRARVEEGPND